MDHHLDKVLKSPFCSIFDQFSFEKIIKTKNLTKESVYKEIDVENWITRTSITIESTSYLDTIMFLNK